MEVCVVPTQTLRQQQLSSNNLTAVVIWLAGVLPDSGIHGSQQTGHHQSRDSTVRE